MPSLADTHWLDEPAGPVLNIHFRKGETSLRMFTTITTLGTPQDVTVQEIRIECFFPADKETEQVFRDESGPQAAAAEPSLANLPATPA